MSRCLIFIVGLSGILLLSSSAEAARRAEGSGQVVHSRMAPVLLHRAVPPFKGVHTYQSDRTRR
jgi:hypothetical protein